MIKGMFNINGKLWHNHIMDDGLKKMMRVLADVAENDINLTKVSLGTSDITSEDTTLTTLVAEVGNKYAIGSHSINAIYPFDLELNTMIPDNEIIRPETVKEIGIWFDDDTLFARATDAVGVFLGVGLTVPVSYDLVIV